MKKYTQPIIEILSIEVQDIITVSVIIQSPDKVKGTLPDGVEAGVNMGNIDSSKIF